MSPRNLVYHLYESVPFTEKRPRRPETGIKDGFEEMEHKFLFGIFLSGKTGLTFQMFRWSRKFSAGTTKKVMFPTRYHLSRLLLSETRHVGLKRSRKRRAKNETRFFSKT